MAIETASTGPDSKNFKQNNLILGIAFSFLISLGALGSAYLFSLIYKCINLLTTMQYRRGRVMKLLR